MLRAGEECSLAALSMVEPSPVTRAINSGVALVISMSQDAFKWRDGAHVELYLRCAFNILPHRLRTRFTWLQIHFAHNKFSVATENRVVVTGNCCSPVLWTEAAITRHRGHCHIACRIHLLVHKRYDNKAMFNWGKLLLLADGHC
jgi:hypothetical protein